MALKRPIVLIMAAGKGMRMKSGLPKVLHEIDGAPLLRHVINASGELQPIDTIIVVGYRAALVRAKIGPGFTYVLQSRQMGTGHAVLKARSYLNKKRGYVLVLSGDVPFLTAKTLKSLCAEHIRKKAAATVLSVILKRPGHYGRIIRGQRGEVKKIIEFKDSNSREKRTREINTGIYCFRIPDLFRALEQVRPKNKQKEYYLTDVIEILIREEKKVIALKASSPIEVTGINTKEELARANKWYRRM